MHDQLQPAAAGKFLLTHFAPALLTPCMHCRYDKAEEAAEFIIDETFGVPGVGTVVAGMVKRGVICTTSSSLLLGPHVGDASFKPAAIKSIHYKRLPVTKVGWLAAASLDQLEPAAATLSWMKVCCAQDEREHVSPALAQCCSAWQASGTSLLKLWQVTHCLAAGCGWPDSGPGAQASAQGGCAQGHGPGGRQERARGLLGV